LLSGNHFTSLPKNRSFREWKRLVFWSLGSRKRSEGKGRRDHKAPLRASTMKEEEKIHLDGNRPAPLYNGAASTDFPRLRPGQAQHATIPVIGGPLHTALEITAASLWTFGKCFSRTSQFGWARSRIVRPLR
jgi:hypothetical protein